MINILQSTYYSRELSAAHAIRAAHREALIPFLVYFAGAVKERLLSVGRKELN